MFKKLFVYVQFNGHITIRLFCFESSSESRLRDIISKNIPGVSSDGIDKLFKFYGEKLLKISEKNVIRNCELCREHNIKTNNLKNIITCLSIKPNILRHRILLLQEMGATDININVIWKLQYYFKKPANKFKEIVKIPEDQHIMANMISHINDNLSDILYLNLLDESLSVNLHYERCFFYYVINKLGSDKVLTKNRGRIAKSFRLMTMLIDIFINKFDIDYQYIQNHLIILDMCPNQLEYALESLKDVKIANLTIQEIFKRYHDILLCDPENVKRLLESLKKYEIDNYIMMNCLRIFKLKNEEFIDRMNKLLELPDLRVWCKTSRILYFILNQSIINKRIKLLRSSDDIKYVNSYLLTSGRSYFDKYIQGKFNFSQKYIYIKYILHKELGSDKKNLIHKLREHQYWNKVSFIDLDDTLRIMKRNFSIEDICSNIHIILYPWSVIRKTLERIQESSEYEKYTMSQQLALCLYLIEKDNHFTGDGIWIIREEDKQSKDDEVILSNTD